LLAIGFTTGFPSIGQGIFMYAGLPGYSTAMTTATLTFGGDGSRSVLVYFGFIYVLVNAAFFSLLLIVGWQIIAACSRFSKRRRI
jgi:hypothetical protein